METLGIFDTDKTLQTFCKTVQTLYKVITSLQWRL